MACNEFKMELASDARYYYGIMSSKQLTIMFSNLSADEKEVLEVRDRYRLSQAP